LLMQKLFHTDYGNFGFEYGIDFYQKMSNTMNGAAIRNSADHAASLFIGGKYGYGQRLYILAGLPYTLYQNKAFITKYTVLLQIDYLLK
ncbi:MAG: hypothetical protein ACP5QD_00680, partial [Candidatus Ratteibacteria bacterium]